VLLSLLAPGDGQHDGQGRGRAQAEKQHTGLTVQAYVGAPINQPYIFRVVAVYRVLVGAEV
jgi:hypothetical protein